MFKFALLVLIGIFAMATSTPLGFYSGYRPRPSAHIDNILHHDPIHGTHIDQVLHYDNGHGHGHGHGTGFGHGHGIGFSHGHGHGTGFGHGHGHIGSIPIHGEVKNVLHRDPIHGTHIDEVIQFHDHGHSHGSFHLLHWFSRWILVSTVLVVNCGFGYHIIVGCHKNAFSPIRMHHPAILVAHNKILLSQNLGEGCKFSSFVGNLGKIISLLDCRSPHTFVFSNERMFWSSLQHSSTLSYSVCSSTCKNNVNIAYRGGFSNKQ